jgi:pilus assembly protein CpaB
VTLIVTEAQATKLIEAEYTGKLHLIFEKRGVSHER